MNVDQIRNDILANLDKLPKKFDAGCFYNSSTDCMCLFGWLNHVVDGTPKERLQPHSGEPSPTWSMIEGRYGIPGGFCMTLLRKADHVIHISDGKPRETVDYFLTYTLPEVATSV